MITLEGKYQIERKVGEGSFGTIFEGCHISSGRRVAIKIEPATATPLLLHEANIYLKLQKCRGVSKLRSFGSHEGYNYIVFDLFELDLEEIFYYHNHMVTDERIFCWGHHILQILKQIHEASILHRDIKPENVMVGRGELHIVDFGLSRFYRDRDGTHYPMRSDKGMVGTTRYASRHVLDGVAASRRDDLESTAYTLLFLYHDTLPWLHCRDLDPIEERVAVRNMKATAVMMKWCHENGTPARLVAFLDYVYSLDFSDTPDYSFFEEYKDINIMEGDQILCRTNELSDKSRGSTAERGTGSSPL